MGDEPPQRHPQPVLLVRPRRQQVARRNDLVGPLGQEGADGYLAGQPLLDVVVQGRRPGHHPCHNRCGLQMHQHVAARRNSHRLVAGNPVLTRHGLRGREREGFAVSVVTATRPAYVAWPVPSIRGYRGAGRGKVAKTVVPHSSDSMRSSWVSLLERRSPSPKPPPFVNDGFAPRPSSATETKRWPGVDRAVTSTRPGSTPRVGVLDGVSNQLADHRLDGEGVGPVVARDLGELSSCPRHGARCRGHSQAEELAGHGVLLPGAVIH